MFLKFDQYRVCCSIFYSKLVNCILFKIIVQHVVVEHAVVGKETLKFGSIFGSLPDFSLSQEREKSSHPVFTMCGEPCCYMQV